MDPSWGMGIPSDFLFWSWICKFGRFGDALNLRKVEGKIYRRDLPNILIGCLTQNNGMEL